MTLGIGSASADYQLRLQQYRASHNLNSAQNTNGVKKYAVSEQGNTCTDGKDDGKIGFWSKAGNLIQGVWNGAKNIVKGAIEHPFKTLAMIGACCIPVVGPAIAIGMGVYGAYQGVKTIANGVAAANSAKTDAQAKDAWENIGTGTFTTAASVVAVKGGAHMLKGQLSGGSTTVNALKTAKADGASIGKLAETAIKEGGAETLSNVKAVGNYAKDKAKAGLEKAKEVGSSIKNNGVKQTAQTYAKAGLEKLNNKVNSGIEKIDSKLNENSVSKATTEQNIQSAKEAGNATGAKVNGTYKNGVPKEVKFDNGSYVKYKADGTISEKVTIEEITNGSLKGQTKVITEKNGVITVERGTGYNNGKFENLTSKTVENASTGTRTSIKNGEESTVSYNNDKTGSSYTEYKAKGADGKVTNEYEFSNGENSIYMSKNQVQYNGKTYTLQDGKYVNTTNPQDVLSYTDFAKIKALQGKIKFNSSNIGSYANSAYARANQFIDYGTTAQNAGLMYMGSILDTKS